MIKATVSLSSKYNFYVLKCNVPFITIKLLNSAILR